MGRMNTEAFWGVKRVNNIRTLIDTAVGTTQTRYMRSRNYLLLEVMASCEFRREGLVSIPLARDDPILLSETGKAYGTTPPTTLEYHWLMKSSIVREVTDIAVSS